jgi:hypothetical protein
VHAHLDVSCGSRVCAFPRVPVPRRSRFFRGGEIESKPPAAGRESDGIYPVRDRRMTADPPCRWCGDPIPPNNGPGRPREFCSRQHRRRWHIAKERLERMIEVGEISDEEHYARERGWYGKRKADQRARARAKERAARRAAWERELWTPGPPSSDRSGIPGPRGLGWAR